MAEKNIYGKVVAGEPYRRAGARLKEDADEVQIRLKVGSPEDYQPFIKAFHQFDKAHLVMLAEQGIIPKQDATKMLEALREMEKIGIEKVRMETRSGLHSGEAWLIPRLGEEVGGKIHPGRSSGDLMAVSARIFIREQCLKLMAASIRFRESLIKLAENNILTLMPDWTMYQHAQPSTLAHHVMSWEHPIERDFSRMEQLYERVNMSPAGAAILTGSGYPIDRKRTAELLGFDGLVENTRDAIFGADCWLGASTEAFTVPAILIQNLSRIAEELYVWYTVEFSLINLADKYCGTSSIMPQKKNPHALMWVRGAASRTYGRLVSYFFEMHDVCWGFTRQLNFDDILYALEIMTGVISTLEVNKERMRESVTNLDWACVTDLADMMVSEMGLPFRTAHQIVAIVVRHGVDAGKTQTAITTEMIDKAAVEYMGKPLGMSEEIIRKALDPWKCVERRKLIGGPAPERVREDIARASEKVKEDKEELASIETTLATAEKKLEAAIDKIISGS